MLYESMVLCRLLLPNEELRTRSLDSLAQLSKLPNWEDRSPVLQPLCNVICYQLSSFHMEERQAQSFPLAADLKATPFRRFNPV